MNANSWQVKRAKGRRIYTGLTRKRVETALSAGKLRGDDLALPPGGDAWITVARALEEFQQDTTTAPEAPEISLPDWVPMQREGRLLQSSEEEDDPAEMEVMPMIDITTLLLIFFLVGGVFMLQARIQLPQAKTGQPVVPAANQPVGIMIDLDPESETGYRMFFEDDSATSFTMEELVMSFEAKVERGFLREAVLKAHRDLPFGIVREAMEKLSETGIAQIRVATEEPR